MCIILPVSHIPCTHTVAIWQHCIEATRSGQDGIMPCWNVKQQEQAVLTRRPCEECSGERFFARRGGIAERGNGSPTTSSEAEMKSNDKGDATDDSGYYSDVIQEEDELSHRPLSPKAIAPPHPRTKTCRQRKHNASSHRTLSHKPSWKPNLKRDLDTQCDFLFQPRRDSIDSLLYTFDATEAQSMPVETRASIKDVQWSATPTGLTLHMEELALTRPSSPCPSVTTGHARTAQAFACPQIVDVRKSRQSPDRMRKRSTLLHPSSPPLDSVTDTAAAAVADPRRSPSPLSIESRPRVLRHRKSSLLHPSLPEEPLTVTAQHRTIMSIPPQAPKPKLSPTYPVPALPLRHMPPFHASQSSPDSHTLASRRRRASVLHSSLSDDEEEDDEPVGADASRLFGLNCFSFGKRRTSNGDRGWWDAARNGGEEDDGAVLLESAKAARASRIGVPGSWGR
jgi:hypothetical protein